MDRPLFYFRDIEHTREYDAALESAETHRFASQGQLKLLIGELFFLSKLHQLALLSGSTVVYIGSAPGTHIRFLVDHFKALGASVRWVLVDGRAHDPALRMPDVTIVTRFVDGRYLTKLRQSLRDARVVLISDIRSKRGDGEPSTEDLLRDYALQNSMVDILKPVASSLKWRCPFPDQWVRDFYMPCGREMLQPFAPTFSAEMRLIVLSINAPPRLRCITLAAARDYERRMFYLNSVVRRRIIVNFDYPNQEYDFFHMFYLLNTVACSCEFPSPKKKVLFLQQAIFRFLGIRLPSTERIRHEPAQRGVPGKDPVPKGRDQQKPVRRHQPGGAA